MTTKDTSAVTPIIAKHLETTSPTDRFSRINIAYTLPQAADNPADAPSRSHHLASLIDALIIPAPPIQASEPRRLEDEIPHGRWAIEALALGIPLNCWRLCQAIEDTFSETDRTSACGHLPQ